MGKMDVKRAYASLNMPPVRYMTMYAAPLVLTGVVVVALLHFTIPFVLAGITGVLLYAIPVYFLVLALIYPYIIAEGKKVQIDNNIHFFITHMGVLATSNIPRADIMKMLAAKKEYGALAEEASKIYALVDSWNVSLAEAARFVSKRTPSEIFADFLDRFAYALESGEELESFLKNEQVVVMEDFAAHYRGALYEVENMKNMFNSMMMSVIFIVIFAILMPVITGIDPTMLMSGALCLVMFIEIIFVYFTKAKSPSDPIWHSLKANTPLSDSLKKSIPVSLAACIGVLVLLLWLTEWPIAIIMACGLTPLVFSGLQAAKAEEHVKRRDDNYAAFIRSLGASTSARGGQVTEVLRHLQNHDFGPLTPNVKSLYQRLNLRVDDKQAWGHFAVDCGSNLIEKFTRMFMEGLKSGGKPDAIGRLISDNFTHIVTLRKMRYQTAGNFRGQLYGLVGGMAFALFVGVGIIGTMKDIFSGIDVGENSPFGDFLNFEVNIPMMGFLVILLLVAHSMASSLMIKIADGGNYFRTWVDFVGLFWVGAIVSVGAEKAIGAVL